MSSVLDQPRIRSYVLEAAGEPGVRLVELLEGKRAATDTELAEKLGERPSHIRKILYNLYEARLAEYTKEKDKETGWLTFFWHLTPDNAEHALDQRRRRALETLKLQLETEATHDWYHCPQGHERHDFTSASEIDFHCEACGAMLEHSDNADRIAHLQAELGRLESES